MSARSNKSRAKAFRRLAEESEDVTAQIGADALSVLIDELSQITKRRRRAWSMVWVFILVGLSLIALLLNLVALQIHLPFRLPRFTSYLIPVIFMPIAQVLLMRALSGARQESLARMLNEWGDVRAIGPLAETLNVMGMDREVVTRALTCLLPDLKASDADLLNTEQRAALFSALAYRPKRYSDFLVTLLGALEQLGDPQAIPHVERMVNRTVKSVQDKRVLEAARLCLTSLQESARRAQVGAALLRASDEAQQPASLLRPAASEQTEAALLLRIEE